MTDRRPEPGSPWARHCPDAWPREWLGRGGELPLGFTRAADQNEADLITGRITEVAFLHASSRSRPRATTPSPPPSPESRKKRKGNGVMVKLVGYRRFFEALPNLEPPLPPGSVAVWCWLWTCAKKGRARCSVRKLAKRFHVTKSTAGRWLAGLTAAGFVRIEERGRTGRSASRVRVRASVPRAARERPADGTRILFSEGEESERFSPPSGVAFASVRIEIDRRSLIQTRGRSGCHHLTSRAAFATGRLQLLPPVGGPVS